MTEPETFSAKEKGVQPLAAGPDNAPGHVKTAGEKKFDWEVYGRIGYYANVAISLVAVFWAERTKMGQNALKDFGKFISRTGLKAETAEFLGRKSFFLAGGFAVIPFMKHFEDHKVEKIKQENRRVHGDKADTDPTIQKSEKELESAPKQTWKSVISGRLLALVPFYAGYWLIWDHKSPLARATNGGIEGKGIYVDQLIARGGRLVGWLGSFVTPGGKAARAEIEALNKATPGIMKSVKEGLHHDPIHSAMPYYFFSEIITSAIVAWGVYVITRVTGPFFGKHQEQVVEAKKEARSEPMTKDIVQLDQQDENTPAKKADTPTTKIADAALASKLQPSVAAPALN